MKTRRIMIAGFLLSATCSMTGTSVAQSTRGPTVTHVFCVHGGVSIPQPPDHPLYYAVVVVDVHLPAAARAPLGVRAFELVTSTGAAAASLAAVENIVQLDVVPPSPQFATYLNPVGRPLTGPLAAGVTRVRIRVRLDGLSNLEVAGYRLTLSGLGAPQTTSGPINGVWGT